MRPWQIARLTRYFSFETTICGGFPVLVEGELEPGDGGEDRGSFGMEITLVNGKDASFVTRKMTKWDHDRLHDEIQQHC